jgi:hypothetical protein
LFLTEARPDFRQGVEIPRDDPSDDKKAESYIGFVRHGSKTATAPGKTTVMGMLAAWSILNKVNDRSDGRFSDVMLIVCPNVTIRDRLQELDPELGEASLYRTRDLVPGHLMSLLTQGRVLVTNWHLFEPQAMQTGGYDDFDEHGRLHEEVAKVFGVPFEVIPFKANKQAAPPPPVKRFHVHALPNRAHLEIKFPRVEGYTQAIRNRVTADWAKIPTLALDPARIPPEVEVKGLNVNNSGRPSLSGPGKLIRLIWKSSARNGGCKNSPSIWHAR